MPHTSRKQRGILANERKEARQEAKRRKEEEEKEKKEGQGKQIENKIIKNFPEWVEAYRISEELRRSLIIANTENSTSFEMIGERIQKMVTAIEKNKEITQMIDQMDPTVIEVCLIAERELCPKQRLFHYGNFEVHTPKHTKKKKGK